MELAILLAFVGATWLLLAAAGERTEQRQRNEIRWRLKKRGGQ